MTQIEHNMSIPKDPNIKLLAGKGYNVWILSTEHSFKRSMAMCLAQVEGLKIHIITEKENSPIKFSRFISSYNTVPKDKSQHLKFIQGLMKTTDKNILMAASEKDMRYVIENYSQISPYTVITRVPDINSFVTATNKGLLASFMEKHDIAHPKTYHNATTENLDEILQPSDYPIMFKTVSMGAGKGIYLCHNADEVRKHINEDGATSEYVLQQYIKGNDTGFSVICNNGEIVAAISQNDFSYRHDGHLFTPAVAREYIDAPDIYDICAKLLKKLNWNGVANLDIYREEETNKLYMLEINARYWASLLGTLAMGINFPVIACCQALGLPFIQPQVRYGYNISLKPYIKHTLKYKYKDSNQPNFQLSDTEIRYVFTDPVPHLLSRVRKTLGRTDY